jgi:hypothetical protein
MKLILLIQHHKGLLNFLTFGFNDDDIHSAIGMNAITDLPITPKPISEIILK